MTHTELIAQQAMQIAELRENYRILLIQIGRMKEGTLKPELVTVDTEALTWRIEAQPPAALALTKDDTNG